MSPSASNHSRVSHRRNPAALLQALTEATRKLRGIDDPAAAREALRAGLRRKTPQDWAVKLVTKLKVKPEYVSQHLIHLAQWDIELQYAVRDGLPLPTARKIATLIKDVKDSGDAKRLIQTALEPFREPSMLSNAKRAQAVEGVVVRLGANRGLRSDASGWLPPSDQPQSAHPSKRDPWIFEPLGRIGVEREMLHPEIARNLIALYSSRGDRVIDPFAGTGVIGSAAHALGRSSYSSDVDDSGSAFINRLNVKNLEAHFDQKGTVADLAILHPPTVESWCDLIDQTPKKYDAWLKAVIKLVSSLLSTGGKIAVIVQPNLCEGLIAATTVIAGFAKSPIKLEALHLAVSSSANQQWLIFVGELQLVETKEEKEIIAKKKALETRGSGRR